MYQLLYKLIKARKKGRILFNLVSLLLLPGVALSQATGKLSGKIVDEKTNESISGASITAISTKYGTSSIIDGTYILTLPVGTYTISYSAKGSGYATKEVPGVVIKAGETNYQNVLLNSAGDLTTVTIKAAPGRRGGTISSVFNLQKRASGAQDGISIDVIVKTPDNNAAQISKRIVGVSVQDNRFVVVRGLAEQYNQTILNGVPMTSTETDRNAFSLDLIPSAVIENIIVNKTATPDMPGNFAGGLVQINTKDFPASNFISVSVQGSINDQTYGKDFYSDKKGKLEWLSFPGKIRNLPDGFPTPLDRTDLIQSNLQEKYRYLSMLKNNLAPVNYGPSQPNHTFQVGFGNTFKFANGSQFGIVMAVSQRKSELIEQEISARTPQLNPTRDKYNLIDYYSDNIRYNYESQLGGGLNFAYSFGNNKLTLKNITSNIYRNLFLNRPYANITFLDILNPLEGERIAGTTHYIEQRTIVSNVLAGEHRTGNGNQTRIDWNINVSNYSSKNPDTRNFLYKKTDSTGYILSDDNVGLDKALASQSRLWSTSKDIIYGGATNINSVFTLFNNKQLFKGGFLFQNRNRKATGFLIPYRRPEGLIDSLLAPSNIYVGGPLDYVIRFASIAGQVGNYTAGSSLIAAYESLENNFGKKLRVIWGIRFENYQQYVNVFNPVYYDNFNSPDLIPQNYTSRNTFNFLPSINIVYALNDLINLRGGFSTTAIRPELKDIAPFTSYDFRSLQVTQGNEELRSTTIKNFDVKFEYFPTAGEIISFSAYYKNILDPIEKVTGVDNTPAVRPVNTGLAYVRGFEVEFRKKLDFIKKASWLSNIQVFGNGSLIQSKVKAGPVNNFFIRSVTEHPLSGQPNYLINAGLSILLFKKTFEATLSYNRSGDFINQLGTFDEILLANGKKSPLLPNLNVKGRELLDLVLTQSFMKEKGKIKFNISNILKAPFIIYQDLNGNKKFDEAATIEKTTNPTLAHGIFGGIDNTPSYILPQRTFSIAISYNFSTSKR